MPLLRIKSRKMKFSNLRFVFSNLLRGLSCFRGGNLRQTADQIRLDVVGGTGALDPLGIARKSSSSSSVTQPHSILRRFLRHNNHKRRDFAASSSCVTTMDDSCMYTTGSSVPPPPVTTPRPKHLLSRRRSSAPITPNTSTRRKTYLSNDKLHKTLARDSILRRSFEEFAADQYASENVSFMEKVFEWRTKHPGDLVMAKDICAMYIFEGSPLQVNISWFSRITVEQLIEEAEEKGGEVPSDLFERASEEITTMMRGGVWSSFVRRGGCDRAVSDVDLQQRQAMSSGSELERPVEREAASSGAGPSPMMAYALVMQ